MSIKFLNYIGKNIALSGAKLIFLKLIPFHSNRLCTYSDHTKPNFIYNFNSHYSDFSKVCNIILASRFQKLVGVRVKGLKRPSVLLSK